MKISHKETSENFEQDPHIAVQIQVLLDLFRRYGFVTFDNGNIDESVGELRREIQNPEVFAVSSLPMQAWWTLPTNVNDLLRSHKDVIIDEYDRFNALLPSEFDVGEGLDWSVKYLLKQGKWCAEPVQEQFAQTMDVLLKLPLIENRYVGCTKRYYNHHHCFFYIRFGSIYFIELNTGSEIRSHCGPTNVNIRVLFPLIIERSNDTEDSDIAISIADERRYLIEGEPLAFDDSFYHSVHIGNDVRRRLALVIDLWHPEIRAEELKSAITGTFPYIEDSISVENETNLVTATAVDSQLLSSATIAQVVGAVAGVDEPVLAMVDSADMTLISPSNVATVIPMGTTEVVEESKSDEVERRGVELGLGAYGEIYRANEYWINGDTGIGKHPGTAISRPFDVDALTEKALQNPYVNADKTLLNEYLNKQKAIFKMAKEGVNGVDFDQHIKCLMVGDSGTGKTSFLMRAVEDTFMTSFITTIGIDFKLMKKFVLNPLTYPTTRLPRESVAIGESENDSVVASAADATPVVAVPVDDVAANKGKEKIKVSRDDERYDGPKRIYKIKCQIWDTAGQERFRTITTSYFRGTNGVLVFYDISDRQSFTSVRNWLMQIQLHASPEVVVVLIGSKEDMDDDGPRQKKEKVSPSTETYPSRRVVSFEEGMALAREFNLPAFLEVSSKDDYQVDDAMSTILSLVLKKRLLYEQDHPEEFPNGGFNDSNRAPNRTDVTVANKTCVIS